MLVRRYKKFKVIMSLIFKNDARSLAMQVTMWLSFKIIDTPVNGLLSLFRIDTVHRMETSLSVALLVY
jgi:hypothetical protein